MSTTDQPSTHTAGNDASTSAPGGTVVPFDALKRRRRLDQLMSARTHLATMAAQQRSHGLDDAQESFSLQLALESTIRDEFPQEYEQYFPNWITAEAAGEHPMGVLTADCGICRSVAAHSGVNLVPPEAA